MPEKLLTLQELSDYLHVSEDKINNLVKEGVISAYKIGGEILRFRIEQIDAIRAEIDARVSDSDRINISETRKNVKERMKAFKRRSSSTASERVSDFFYFNDFYIVSGILIVILLVFILRG